MQDMSVRNAVLSALDTALSTIYRAVAQVDHFANVRFLFPLLSRFFVINDSWCTGEQRYLLDPFGDKIAMASSTPSSEVYSK